MLRFVLSLLYFFRFHFVFLFVKSDVGGEVCALASHLHANCFQTRGRRGSLRAGGGGGGSKHFRTGGVTNLEGGTFDGGRG